MRALFAGSIAAAAMACALAVAPASASAEPSVSQVYGAAAAGRMDEAQRMMDQVLRDHPGSSKAHFVQAELYAREGKLALARSELDQAQQLKPGLPDENPRSVQELNAALAAASAAPLGIRAGHFPWGSVLIISLVIAVFWMLVRRRSAYAQYPSAGAAPAAQGPGGYGPGTYGAGGYPAPGGLGSTIAGGLAGGLAAGAGIVAGEELAHHFLDGGHAQGGLIAPANAGEWDDNSSNADLGGANFGVKDPGTWDDGGGLGGDAGGGDWS